MKIEGNPRCQRCELHETTDNVCIMGQGAKKTDVVIVGEAPGASEEAGGDPFIGESGQLLRGILKKNGLKDFYVTNAVQCRPPGNRTPTAVQVKSCYKWLNKELETIKPKFVLLLGNIPCSSVLGLRGITELRGKSIVRDGVVYFPSFHPAYALRSPDVRPVIEADIRRFSDLVFNRDSSSVTISPTVIERLEDAEEALRDIRNSTYVAFDIETSGLNPWENGAYVTSIGMATPRREYIFMLNHLGTAMYDDYNKQLEMVKAIHKAVSRGAQLVAHNGKFDSLFLKVIFGVTFDIDFDTMLAHYNLDENSRHSLDRLSAQYLGAEAYDVPLRIKHGLGGAKDHALYLAKDIRYTMDLFKIFAVELEKDPHTHRLFSRLTMEMSTLYRDIEYNGCYIVPSRLRAADRYWTEERAKYAKRLSRYGPVNYNSPKQVAQVLFNDLGIKPIERTKKGAWSTSESVLMRIDHPIAGDILKWRGAEKQLNTFIQSWDARRDGNSRIHPNFLIHGTVTGRPSCKEPNLQQTPRDPRIRNIVEAPEGWVLVQFDISQAEMRIAAEMSQCPNLMKAFLSGKDVHVMIVQSNFGITNPTKDERKKGKAINFGYLFGMGSNKFKIYARDNYGITVSDREARQSRKNYFNTWSGLGRWHERQKKFARSQGYVRSLIGRKRRLPHAQGAPNQFLQAEAERQAINSPVQGFATDWNVAAAIELRSQVKEKHMKLAGTIHDATLAWIRPLELEPIVELALEIFSNPRIIREDFGLKMRVPMMAEASIGPWGSGVSLEEYLS